MADGTDPCPRSRCSLGHGSLRPAKGTKWRMTALGRPFRGSGARAVDPPREDKGSRSPIGAKTVSAKITLEQPPVRVRVESGHSAHDRDHDEQQEDRGDEVTPESPGADDPPHRGGQDERHRDHGDEQRRMAGMPRVGHRIDPGPQACGPRCHDCDEQGAMRGAKGRRAAAEHGGIRSRRACGDPREDRTGVEDPRVGRAIGAQFAGRRAQDAEAGEERRGDDLDAIIASGTAMPAPSKARVMPSPRRIGRMGPSPGSVDQRGAWLGTHSSFGPAATLLGDPSGNVLDPGTPGRHLGMARFPRGTYHQRPASRPDAGEPST